MDSDDERVRPDAAFFGRRQGRTLRPKAADALRTLLPRYRIDLAAPPPADLRTLFAQPVGTLRLEIGFGGGEHLLHRATADASTGFIGVEPFVNGMAGLMTALDDRPLGNVRVYDDDATWLLDWLPRQSLSGIDLLYPDPWPKRRHWKRRFVNPPNLDRFARVLTPDAAFRFASDIDDYVNWTLDHCRRHGAFEWNARRAGDWRQPFEGWPGTRYEGKAIAEGRRPAYLTFQRR